jgi:hypothetical protein
LTERVIVMSEPDEKSVQPRVETPAEWANRLTGKLSGLLKDEMAAYGGGDAFVRWVRGHDDGEDDPWVIYGMNRLNQSDKPSSDQGK